MEDCVTACPIMCFGSYTVCGLVLALSISVPSLRREEDIWAGVGDRRGWRSARHSPRFSSARESGL